MSKRRFASSILLLNRGGVWTGLDLEYGHVMPASGFHEAFVATRDAVEGALTNGVGPPKPPVEWVYGALYRLAVKHGHPAAVNESRHCLATHIAVPVLFAYEESSGQWRGRTHVAYAVRSPVPATLA